MQTTSAPASEPVRSLLFVPGDRAERIPKALASGADRVIVDLEDAVAVEAKATARTTVRAFLDANPQARVIVRVNARDVAGHVNDLALCRHPGVIGVMLPKADNAHALADIARQSGKPVWPIIESAAGLLAVAELARAPGCARLVLGTLDFALDLSMGSGTDGAERMLDVARFALLLQSCAAGLPRPIDGVFPVLDDAGGLAAAARRSREAGYGGMLCIHPRQVAAVNAAFAPTSAEIDWAIRVVAAAEGAAGAFTLDGLLVDAPVIEHARRLLATPPDGRL